MAGKTPVTVAELTPEQRAHWDTVKANIQKLARERASARQAEGARNAARARQDNALLARVQSEPDKVSSVPVDEEVHRAKLLFARNTFALLAEPAVMANFRDKLSGGDARAIRDVLGGLTGLLAAEGSGGSGGATRITLVNKVPRPARDTAIDITPKSEEGA